MTISQCFRSLSEATELAANEALALAFSPKDDLSCEALLDVMIARQAFLAEKPKNALIEWTESFLQDVATLSLGQAGDDLLTLQFLRFSACTGALTHCFGTGQNNRAAAWIARALNDSSESDKNSTQLELHPERLRAFLNSQRRFLLRRAPGVICTWAQNAYAYFHTTKSLDPIGRASLDSCWEAIRLVFPQDIALRALTSIAYWTIDQDDGLARHVAGVLETLYGNGDVESAQDIAVALNSRLGEMTARGKAGWLDAVLNKHWNSLNAESRLCVLADLLADLTLFDERREELDELFEQLRPPSHYARAAIEQHRERLVAAFGRIIINLLGAGRSVDAVALLCRWYGIPDDQRIRDALFCVPFTSFGPVWAYGDHITIVTQDSELRPTTLAIMNKALGTVISPPPGSVLPERFGTPDPSLGENLLDVIANQIGLPTFSGSEIPPETYCLPLTSAPMPLQGVMLRKIGHTWPFTVSLKERRPDREVRRVGVWIDGLLLGDEELDAITRGFRQYGARVDVQRGAATDNSSSLRSIFTDPEYDVVWIIAHGDQVAFAPDENAFEFVGNQERLEVGSLAELEPLSTSRRLLVMNVCSGAKPTGHGGGLPRMSMAGICASPSQAVISHLWRTIPFASYAFGVALGLGLCKQTTFFNAYCDAVHRVQSGNKEFAAVLQEEGLLSHAALVRDNKEDLSNPIHSCSAAFYE